MLEIYPVVIQVVFALAYWMRQPNTNADGRPWTRDQIDAVWIKAKAVTGYDPAVQRLDDCGAWIRYSEFRKGVEKGKGWEIDHIQPVAQGGDDDLSNLRPIQWQNNRHKDDDWPTWTCLVSSDYVGPFKRKPRASEISSE